MNVHSIDRHTWHVYVHNTVGTRDLSGSVDCRGSSIRKSSPLARPNCDVSVAPPSEFIY